MLLMHYGMVNVLYLMKLSNEAEFCNSNGGRCNDEENRTLLRMKPYEIQQQQQQQQQTIRSTEEELRKAAGGKCYDTFLHEVQGWTSTDIDAISTITQKSPIHMAAWKGNIHNLIYFIDTLGCNINRISQMKYSYGKTCLFFALTQSRCDVVDYLLECGAHVKIINNKGQSPLSIASSHFYNDHDRYITSMIVQAEQSQAHIEWVNYRTTHSDYCTYGDLDPRFLHTERPIQDDTDVVTPYAINPTTKAIRRSGLYRKLNNFTFDHKEGMVMSSNNSQESQQQSLSSTITTRRRNTPKRDLSPEDIVALDAAWSGVKICVKNEISSNILMDHVWTIVRVHSKLQKAWIPEVVVTLRQIDVNDAVIPSMFQVLLSESSNVILSKQDRTLIRRVYNYYIDPSCYRQQSEVDRTNQASSSTQQPVEMDRLLDDDMAWHDAYNIVKDLYLQQLIAGSVTRSIESPTHNHESKSSSLYLTLPYEPIWVDTIEKLSKVRESIKCTPLVAIDAEWHDNDGNRDNNDKNSMLSTLQIALVHNTATNDNPDGHNYDTVVWVIDLIAPHEEYRNMCESFIRELLSTKIVLGFSLSNDMKRLKHYCDCPHKQHDPPHSSISAVSTKCVLDIQRFWKHTCSPAQMLGLARCVQDVMVTATGTATTKKNNVVLTKEYQCSNWSQRPLSSMQLQYAGLDAVIVLYLFSEQYRRIHSQHGAAGFGPLY